MKKSLPIVLLVSSLALSVQGCKDPVEKANVHLQNGKSLFDQQDYDKAKLEFKNAIQLNNKLAEAYYYLGLMEEKKQNWQAMFANLSEAVKLDANHIQAHLKLAQLKLLSGQVDQARQEVESVIALEPNNVAALALKGAILLKQGVKSEALALADQALTLSPGHTDAVSLKAAVFMQDKDYPAALKLIDETIKLKPDDVSLHLLRLQVHGVQEDKLALEQDYQGLVKQFPDNLDFQFALAKFYAETDRSQETDRLLSSVVERHPAKLKAKQVYVEFLAGKNPADAIAKLQQYTKQQPEAVELQLLLSKLYLGQKQWEEAKQPLLWVVEHKPDAKEALMAKVALATIALQNKGEAEAEKWLNEVFAVDARHYDAMLLKAKMKLVKDKIDDALTDLRGLTRDYPDKDEPFTLMAKAYLKQNSPELAIENFRKALEINPANFEAVMPVVSQMINSKDLNRAEETLNKALQAKPDQPEGLQAMAQLKLLKKDWQGVTAIADKISSMPKGSGFSRLLAGKIAQGQGMCDAAIVQYKEALLATPTLNDALNGMAACYEMSKGRGTMLAYLDDFIKANAEADYAVILKSRLLVMDKKANEAISLLKKFSEARPNVTVFYEALAELYTGQQDKAAALASLDAGLTKSPDDVSLLLQKASLHEQSADFDVALKVYESLVKLRPDLELATNNLVSLLLDHFSTPNNLNRAVKLSERFKDSKQPYFKDTYAWALFKAGQLDQALPIMKEVVANAPDAPVFQYHLAEIEAAKGNKPIAIEHLQKALANKMPGFVEKALAEALLQKMQAQ